VNAPAAFDEIAGRYDTTGAQFAAPIAARVVDLAGLMPGQKVLDAGCGAGAVLLRAATAVAPGGHVTGIDLSPRMLERAAAEAGRRGLAGLVTVRPGDAACPSGAAGYDAVLSSLVLYLLPDPAAALAAWRVLLVPGGVLVFSWATAPDPRWLPVFAAVEAHTSGAPGFFSYTSRLPQPGGMETALRTCGYQHITTTTETITTRYHSPQHWWDAASSEGPWVSWRHIPPARLPDARADALTLLEPMRNGDGTLTRTIQIAYATAHQDAR
jgi:ubiquinone/menaquinone biosynthesis C-methylase UbiE